MILLKPVTLNIDILKEAEIMLILNSKKFLLDFGDYKASKGSEFSFESALLFPWQDRPIGMHSTESWNHFIIVTFVWMHWIGLSGLG